MRRFSQSVLSTYVNKKVSLVYSVLYFPHPSHEKELRVMSDLNRGIMKFEGADKPAVVAISSIIVIGSIIALILWAMKVAYI